MLVVPDIGDMFVPLSEGFLVDHMESRCARHSLSQYLADSIADPSLNCCWTR